MKTNMDANIIKSLIAQAMATGSSAYQAWRIDYFSADAELRISHNGSLCATFEIEGFERGHLRYHGLCPALERAVLDQIDLYMQGVAI